MRKARIMNVLDSCGSEILNPLQSLMRGVRWAAEGAEDIIREDAMRELLRAVDLDYLLERHGMHSVVDWGRILSLGACPLPASGQCSWRRIDGPIASLRSAEMHDLPRCTISRDLP